MEVFMASRTHQLAQSVGFGLYGEIAYGRMNGIFFNASINNYNGNCTVRAYVKRANGIDAAGADMFLAENRKKYRNAKASYDGKSLNVIITNYIKLNVQTVADFLSDFSMFLKNSGYFSACAFCEKTDNLGYSVQEDRVLEACPECHEKLEGILSEMKQERAQTGSYLRGAAGAVLGGIIGIIPWVLIGMIGYIASISALIMAFLSYKLYLLFKGKRGPGMLVIVILVLIIFTYLGVVISDGISIINVFNEEGVAIDNVRFLTDMVTAPFSPGIEIHSLDYPSLGYYVTGDEWAELIRPIWGDIAMGYFFAALGSFIYLARVRKESSGKDLEVKRLSQNM
jgi:hypothetical protein